MDFSQVKSDQLDSNSVQNFNQNLICGSIIRLFHLNAKHYLMSESDLELQKGFFKKIVMQVGIVQKEQQQLVGGSKFKPDDNSLWEVLYCQPSELWYDDQILLRHLQTQTYLIIDKDSKSQTTQQSAVFCTKDLSKLNQGMFQIKRIDDPYIQWEKKSCISQRITNHSRVRIVNVVSQLTLHSHKSQYKQPDANHLHEITGFSGRDNNDIWEIHIVSMQYQQLNNSRILKEVHYEDQIILRNNFYGGSIVAETNKNGSSLPTLSLSLAVPREENQHFQILEIVKEKQEQYLLQSIGYNTILNGSIVKIKHSSTNKSLLRKGNTIVFDDFQEIINNEEWEIIVVQSELDYQEKVFSDFPILIYNKIQNSYLRATQSQKKDFKLELSEFVTQESVWEIEKSENNSNQE